MVYYLDSLFFFYGSEIIQKLMQGMSGFQIVKKIFNRNSCISKYRFSALNDGRYGNWV